MKKFIGILFILLAGLVGTAQAQVSAITITGAPGCGPTGQAVTINFSVTGAADYGTTSYDILFSSATTATSSAYSSFLGGPMVCSNSDTGFYFYDNGQATNTVSKIVALPYSGYSGNVIILAQQGVIYLSCSSPTTYASFPIPCSPTPTATLTFTNTATNTPTNSPTNTPTITPTNSPTLTPTGTKTNTFTNTATTTPTNTPTNTPTATPTNSPTNTATVTSTPTGSFTYTPTNVNSFTPTITPTFATYVWVDLNPCGTATWVPYSGYSVASSCTFTPTATYPAGTNTPTATPTFTPSGFSFGQDTTSSTAVTIAAAVAGYYNNIRGFTIGNSNATTSGAVYIDDGSVTLWGPVTLSGNVGINVDRNIYSQAANRPLRFFNLNSVSDIQVSVNYSIDLPGVK